MIGGGEPRARHLRPEGGSRREAGLNDAEIRRFLDADYPRLVNAMALVCGSFAAAEDAVQEALARAWERSERGHYIGSVPGWVATVARNLLRDRFRRAMAERRARERLAVRPVGSSGVVQVERRADVERALAGLPRRQREVAVFHYFLDLEVSEIASVLGVPEGTVKSALHRARRSLGAALGESVELEVGDVADR